MKNNYYESVREHLAATVDFFETLAELHPEIAVFEQCAEKAKDELFECVDDVTDIIKDITDEFRIL